MTTGQEIVIFDGVTHGYDNLTWQKHDETKVERTIKKSDFGQGKIYINTESLPDDESEWELDHNGNVITEHNIKIPWSEFKRNAITWLAICLITKSGKTKEIIDEELA